MSPALLGCICGVVWFSVFMAAHVALLFFREGASPSSVLVRVFAATIVFAAATGGILVQPIAGSLFLAEIYVVLVMACLFILYAPFFFTIYTSLSIESLLIARECGDSVPVNLLYNRFASPRLVSGRLAAMVDNGYLVRGSDRYRATPKGRKIAGLFSAIKNAWQLGPGG